LIPATKLLELSSSGCHHQAVALGLDELLGRVAVGACETTGCDVEAEERRVLVGAIDSPGWLPFRLVLILENALSTCETAVYVVHAALGH